ncbi:NUDIX hydrolase [Herbaspirillum rubrisubalbicans]|jgi:ADP-ribose pyrophosphatase YjhB (NUDIX family)|uniref:NUDIX hydrolase n=2 Tax=Herbaspirillum rubrisubalbicans TaxID=80842 RepID=A0ABX9C0C0_9BURK|nr:MULTISPECIES: NUDIX domain-containing protein [Herbaspirillum]MCP1575077.1 ADP-ribose pyrophosphatase YjhB (NUDIX family) [Herbaspirillum rubrisubalbicans]NQE49756.1 NUDIX hydrolase [Herbaspirillum rubrisubalbicans]QJQ03586.1 NUDIX hydrolase [Herbaspirillum rubrisubalbicans Os34]RAM63780.1 NUDIX hydrolase [Herbaspirillum rubrisubalbicans]RAN44757.1 NUDIX hydrolase [Herbaspirillum rubrisubalbicans]
MDPVICTVDVALLTLAADGLEVALLKREHAPFKGVTALPGGYIHTQADADARDAARRVLLDKTGIAAPYLEQLATFSGAARDPRGWSVSIAYYALVPAATIAQAERSQVRLYSVDRLPPLPFDHSTIIDTAVSRLRSKSQYSSLPCHLLGEAFTLPQLQRVYEILLGETINKVSFRRKMSEMDMLDAVDGQFDSSGAHRPAQLYRLKSAFREQLQLLERGL